MSRDFKAKTAEYRECIEQYLSSECSVYPNEPQTVLFDAMRYSLLAGGKRLRPVLVLEFCSLCGGDWKQAVPFAAAVEMIHTYSLIHDDLPCMDDDDYRRGKLTNHKVYGEAMAVLAGDALLTAAFTQVSEADNIPAEIRVKAVQTLAVLSGELGMVGGQVLDMQSENRLCTEQEVLDIQSRKTGALIKAACVLGVLAGNGTQEQIHAAEGFSEHLGLAFQIRDDVLDVIGDASELGKAVGVDVTKNTFVRLFGLEKCEALIRSHTNEAIDALSCFESPDYLVNLAKELTDRMT